MCEHSFVVDDGEYVCESCGSIGDRFIDEGAEWRNYDDGKEEKGRTGFCLAPQETGAAAAARKILLMIEIGFSGRRV